ncbi:hypothetical protein ACFLU6_13490, partial [Acidobacteriota bacterium]
MRHAGSNQSRVARWSLIEIIPMLLAFIGLFAGPALAANPAPAQTYYVPMPEAQVHSAYSALYGASDDPMHTVISISTAADGALIYYDQWEDGAYDDDIANPDNLYSSTNVSGTQIWGDGDATNGCPPNFSPCSDANDVLMAGDVIVLENDVILPRDAGEIFYDGSDKIGASSPVAITRAAWDLTPGTVLATAVEVIETDKWGVSFETPVGEDLATSYDNSMFEYTAVLVMAAKDNTSVQIQTTGGPLSVTLNQGEGVRARVNLGAAVTASQPVQVHLITGDIGERYESRAYYLSPLEAWGSSLYTSVGSTKRGTSTIVDSDVFLYNPSAASITVYYNFANDPITYSVTVSAGGSSRVTMPTNSGAHFYTTSGSPFFALGTIDSANASRNGNVHDWGFSLVQEFELTSQVLIGWGPGSDDLDTTPGPDENTSPVWVSAIGSTTIFADYDGIGGKCISSTQATGVDISYAVTALQSVKIEDTNDNDATGMRIFTCDGTQIIAAWGQDPADAQTSQPALDLGTTVPPLPEIAASKGVELLEDVNQDGKVGPGDKLRYTIRILNVSPVIVPANYYSVTDNIPPHTTYILGTTYYNNSLYPDDSSPNTPFPVDEGGITNDVSLDPGGEHTLTFDVTVEDNLELCFQTIINNAFVFYGNHVIRAEAETYLRCTGCLEISKDPDLQYVMENGTATFDITVSNCGDFLLTDVTVNDPLVPDCNETIGTLDVDQTYTYTCTQDTVSADFTNIATVTGIDPENEPVEDTDEAVVEVMHPGIAISKSGPDQPVYPGPVTFSITVENTGDVELTDVTVSDPLAPDCDRNFGTLAAGASITYTCTVNVTNDLTNVASVIGTDPNDQTWNDDDSAVVTVLKPAIALTKTATPGTYDSAGDIISYTLTATNTGNVTLYGVTISDPMLPSLICTQPVDLNPNESLTCTGSYIITQADLDAGSVTNTAAVNASDPNDQPVSDGASETVEAVQTPGLTLDKTAAPATYNEVGDVINYSYEVTNSGNVTLEAPFSVSDDKTTVDCSGAPALLAPGDSFTCTATYTITQADLDAGSVTNTAQAQGHFGTTPVNSNEDDVTVEAVQTPELTLDKTAAPATYDEVGDVISYNYLVMNTGNVTLYAPFAVNDDKSTDEACPATPTSLAPGESITCTATYTITQADLDAGTVVNTATATAKDPNDQTVTSNEDTETVNAIQNAVLTLDKTATPSEYDSVGDVITYGYQLLNEGNVTLYAPFAVDDDKSTDEACPATPTSLAPGESITCTATYTITQADLDAGFVTNTATATALDPNNQTVTSNQDIETVNAIQNPVLTLDKTASPSDYDLVGDVIAYSYQLMNEGNVTLYAPFAVDDDKTLDESCPATPASIAPGESITCTATYTITQA